MSSWMYIMMLLSSCACFGQQSAGILPATRGHVLLTAPGQIVTTTRFTRNPACDHLFCSGFINDRSFFPGQDPDNWFSRGSSFWGYGLWVFQVLSHFLVLLALNALFGKFFGTVNRQKEGNGLRTFGLGLIYLLGLPLLAVFSLLTLFGLPFGLLLLLVFVLSLWIGDCLLALLLCHYLNSRNERSWNFWTIVLLSLGVVIVLDLLLFFPVLGVLCYMAILAYTYGTLANMILETSDIRSIREHLLVKT